MPTKTKKYFQVDPNIDILSRLGLNTENLPDLNLEELMAPQVLPSEPPAQRKELANLFGLLSDQPEIRVPSTLKPRLSPEEIATVEASPDKTARLIQILSWLGGPATGIPGLLIGAGMRKGEREKKEAILARAQKQQDELEQIYATASARHQPPEMPKVGTDVEATASELFKDKVPNYAGYNSLTGTQQAIVTAEIRRRSPGQWIPVQNPDGSISYTFVGRREGGGPSGLSPAGLMPPKEKIPTSEIKDIATSIAALDNLDLMINRADAGKIPSGLKGLIAKRVASNELLRSTQGTLESLLKKNLISNETYEYIAAYNQFRLSAQAIIKGIPSNYDVLTLLETIGAIEMPPAQRATLLNYAKHLFTKIIEHTVALQKASGRSVPPEFLEILNSAGVDPDTAKMRAYKSLPDISAMLKDITGKAKPEKSIVAPPVKIEENRPTKSKFKGQVGSFMVEEE